MASAAILGASGGLALAQTANPNVAHPNQGQLAAPYGAGPAANNNNNAWGIANTPTGSAAAGPLSTIYAPNVDAVPAPGTIVIRLNGRVESDMVADYTSAGVGLNANGTPNGYKLNPVGFSTYLRLYPGFDGMAANGLRYGAAAEIRTAFYAGITQSGGGGASTTPGTQSSASGNTSAETLYVRRVFTYLASDRAGIVRIGQTDGVIGLFDNMLGRRRRHLPGRTAGDLSHWLGRWRWLLLAMAGAGWQRVWQHQDRLPDAAVLRLRLWRAVCAEHGQRVLEQHPDQPAVAHALQPGDEYLYLHHLRR
jgi:hypothetical protein